MMQSSRWFRPVIFALSATLALSACANNKAKKDQSYVARDVETLYSIAKDTLEKRQYKLAAAQFDEVERQQCAASAPLDAVLGADAPVDLSGGSGGSGGPISPCQSLYRQLGVDKELGDALE